VFESAKLKEPESSKRDGESKKLSALAKPKNEKLKVIVIKLA
jgi:hypothetical protein